MIGCGLISAKKNITLSHDCNGVGPDWMDDL